MAKLQRPPLSDFLVSVPPLAAPRGSVVFIKVHGPQELYAGPDHLVTSAFLVTLNWLLKCHEVLLSLIQSGDNSIWIISSPGAVREFR